MITWHENESGREEGGGWLIRERDVRGQKKKKSMNGRKKGKGRFENYLDDTMLLRRQEEKKRKDKNEKRKKRSEMDDGFCVVSHPQD